jgi:methylenetetrahydrofolate--tRNA-(uracil-5-)-methyltransferase
MNDITVAIIGAGLAGCEAALVLSRYGIRVEIFEARPQWCSPAHKTDLPAELVCSNSFKSCELPSAHGLLKAELRRLQSPLLHIARECAVDAGSALAVDRELFSTRVLQQLNSDANITVTRKELSFPPENHRYCIIAAGPLASEPLVQWLLSRVSSESLHFYDAIAPIVSVDSLDMSIIFSASRWKEGEGDYLNCPFTKDEYTRFYDALCSADQVNARSFEDAKFFEACLPVEVAAQRGFDALAFGPLRPVGLTDPRTGRWPYAVCQLRKENASAESYNMVGFQTRLTISEQKKVFSLIPGMQNVDILRYGSIHRNTYLDSPRLLAADLSFRSMPDIYLCGQMCGSEGYTESIATGHSAARFFASRIKSGSLPPPPGTTALGSLLRHVTSNQNAPFTPSNVHFGLFEPFLSTRKKIGKKEKKELYCQRALEEMDRWIADNAVAI